MLCVCVCVGGGGIGGGGRDRDLACTPQIARALIPNPVPDRAVSSDSSPSCCQFSPGFDSEPGTQLNSAEIQLQYEKYVISRPICSPLFRRSIFPKVHCSEGSLFRRSIVPKKRFIVPKVYWSEGSFIRNRGLLLRRFIVPK